MRGRASGFCLHATGGSKAERTKIRALKNGRIEVITGAQGSGQSHRETLAAIAAAALDLPIDRIDVREGDSAVLETGGGTGGSNLMAIAGNNVHITSHRLIDEARTKARISLRRRRPIWNMATAVFA